MLINRKVKFKIIWNIFKSHSLLNCVVFYDVRTCGVDFSVNVIRNKHDGGVDKNPKKAKNHREHSNQDFHWPLLFIAINNHFK